MIQLMLNTIFFRVKSQKEFFIKQIVMVFLLLLPIQSVHALKISKNFDHFDTNFMLNGAHARIKCATCHNRGLFKGTPRQCTGCHSASSSIAVSKMSNNHIKSNESCDNCHTENRWAGARIDHASISGSCFSCHNGRNAIGKNSRHVRSSNLCDDCHRTVAWRPARFTHSNVTQPCATCHNGSGATGKNATHIQTTASCDACHSTRGWRPAKFVHENIVANCKRCHNGTTATGIPRTGHVSTTASCELCHRTRAWKPASFTHDAVTGSCSNCHGSSATGKNTGHFITTVQCDMCHNTRGWKPVRYSHTGIFPSNHSKYSCRKCHTTNNQNDVGKNPGKNLIPDCGGCHGKVYNEKLKDHKSAPLASNSICTAACHKPAGKHTTRDF